MSLNGFGEMLPRAENRCTIRANQVDAWGVPTLHIECDGDPTSWRFTAHDRQRS